MLNLFVLFSDWLQVCDVRRRLFRRIQRTSTWTKWCNDAADGKLRIVTDWLTLNVTTKMKNY